MNLLLIIGIACYVEEGGGEGSCELLSGIVDDAISVNLIKWNKLCGDCADKS